MAKLILSMDGLVLKEYPLTKERTSIGRKPHNDIQIDNLAVSGEHAVIVTILNDSFLEDLGSTNGTLVNGQPIKKHFMQNNDVIELGKYKLKYMAEVGAGAAKTADFERTMVLRPKGGAPAQAEPVAQNAPIASAAPAPRPAVQPADALAAATSPGMPVLDQRRAPAASPALGVQAIPGGPTKPQVAAIQVLTGTNAGRELELSKPLTTLGKPGVQVAVITKRPQGYFLTHVEGASFPVLNGRTLDAQAHGLSDHDVIELAGVKMEFYFK